VTVAPTPLVANDMKHDVEALVPVIPAVMLTRTLPEAPTATVIVGPTVVRST
jgi:hypothetical protein